jgi:hypothetical protein
VVVLKALFYARARDGHDDIFGLNAHTMTLRSTVSH